MDDVNYKIIQTKEIILNSFNSGDVKGIASNYAKEAKMFPPNSTEIQGINRIAAFWRITIKNGVKRADLDSIRIWESGSTAFEIGKYCLYQDNGKLADFGDYIAIWRNKNDIWKLYLHQWISCNSTDFNEKLNIQINEEILKECEFSSIGCSYISSDGIKCKTCLY